MMKNMKNWHENCCEDQRTSCRANRAEKKDLTAETQHARKEKNMGNTKT